MKTLFPIFLILQTLYCFSQTEQNFRVKKPTENKKEYQPYFDLKFLTGIDTVGTNELVCAFDTSRISGMYDSITVFNLKLGKQGGLFLLTSSRYECTGVIKLLQKDLSGNYSVKYMHSFTIIDFDKRRKKQ